MFPHATDGLQANNDKFSPCSTKHISSLLRVKKDDCFVGEERFAKGLKFKGVVAGVEGHCTVTLYIPAYLSIITFTLVMCLKKAVSRSAEI